MLSANFRMLQKATLVDALIFGRSRPHIYMRGFAAKTYKENILGSCQWEVSLWLPRSTAIIFKDFLKESRKHSRHSQ
jgi:hypothetical protein